MEGYSAYFLLPVDLLDELHQINKCLFIVNVDSS